ncbi:MAG: arylamine N-acetyltransferase [Bacteroidota bacterium]
MDTDAYLDRIGYRGLREPTLDTLRALQRTHLRQVPFENLDIYRQQEIRIDLERFYDKIVRRRRGGFCFEVNGLFNELLQDLGFSTHFITCNVFSRTKQQFTSYYEHVAIVAKLEEDWLVDVGFGTNFPEPLRLATKEPQLQDSTNYQLVKLNAEETLLQRFTEGEVPTKMYKFKCDPQALADFSEMCVYHQTSPESLFTRGKLCSLMTTEGRITLTDKSFIETKGDEKWETPVKDQAAFEHRLKEHFGIVL